MSASLPLSTSVAVPSHPVEGELERQGSLSSGKQWFRSVWFTILLFSICFEGLGRRLVPAIPSMVFYFLKDAVLLVGLIRFRVNRDVMSTFRVLYRGYSPFLKLAILWTFGQLINPEQLSLPLGLLGLRAYWFWWVAPLVVASVLSDRVVRRKAVYLQAMVATVVALFAVLQFGAPAEDEVNTYAIVDGVEVRPAEVGTTGRVRVASTFSFITGFTDFAVLVPVLLLSIGLGEKDPKARLAALIATLFSAAALPMSGSRAPFVLSMALCALVAWRTGLIFTKAGRRVILLAVAGGFTMVFAFPDALQGVFDRFSSDDTQTRFEQFSSVIPPMALMSEEYPFMGLGTGMMQSFRTQLNVPVGAYGVETELVRVLIELGVFGYLLVWITRLGLAIALWRASKILKEAGRHAAAGAAVSYMMLTFYGSMAFDHTFAALYFVGFGIILQEVVHALPAVQSARNLAKSEKRQPQLDG